MNLPNMLKAKLRNNSEVKTINYENEELKLKNKNFYVKTYGCQMNEHDSEKIKGILFTNKMSEVFSIEEADLIILNTCAIRENAHDKVFGFLGRVKHLKESKPEVLLGICGCMAQEESVVNEILDKYKYVDFVIGTDNIEEITKVINERLDKNISQVEVSSELSNICEGIPELKTSNISAWVDIILGCDKFCTYCIVPYTRGKQRSRTKENIINEIIDLKNKGYKEVTLLGQNVNAYGKDLYPEYNLANLLKDVSETKIDRIRFVTSHPWDFTDEMIEVISKCDNVMPYIHLPIQSGSDKILKLMGRRYNTKEYIKLYNKIRKSVKNVSITTDIIVGFPGETEEDFNETLELVDTCKFDGAFTFIFSPRENTPASEMKDDVELNVKRKRLSILNEKVNYYSNIHNQKLIGCNVKCLITGVSEKDKNKITGYTENMKLVNIVGDKSLVGKIVNVLITDAKSFSLNGIVKK